MDPSDPGSGSSHAGPRDLTACVSRLVTSVATTCAFGDLLLVVPRTRGAKLAQAYLGPMKVISSPYEHQYRVQDLFDPSKACEVHAERLHHFVRHDDVMEDQLGSMAHATDSGKVDVECELDHNGQTKHNVRFLIQWVRHSEVITSGSRGVRWKVLCTSMPTPNSSSC